MRLASSIEIVAENQWDTRPARVVLKDDEHDEMASIPLKDLAEALAPFLIAQIAVRGNKE